MGVKAWITVNGQHIPIMEGESKASAVGKFIKGKRKEHNRKVVRKADNIVENIDTKTGNFKGALKKGIEYYEKHIDRPTIKGRAMTLDDNVYELGDIAEQQLMGKISKYKANKMMDKVGEKFRRSHYQWSGDRYKLGNKYKTERITSGEKKLENFARVSKSSYNVSNIKAEYTPKGNIHIMTKDGKDIMTVGKNNFSTTELNALKKRGLLK